jgi:hypothetical protein
LLQPSDGKMITSTICLNPPAVGHTIPKTLAAKKAYFPVNGKSSAEEEPKSTIRRSKPSMIKPPKRPKPDKKSTYKNTSEVTISSAKHRNDIAAPRIVQETDIFNPLPRGAKMQPVSKKVTKEKLVLSGPDISIQKVKDRLSATKLLSRNEGGLLNVLKLSKIIYSHVLQELKSIW